MRRSGESTQGRRLCVGGSRRWACASDPICHQCGSVIPVSQLLEQPEGDGQGSDQGRKSGFKREMVELERYFKGNTVTEI